MLEDWGAGRHTVPWRRTCCYLSLPNTLERCKILLKELLKESLGSVGVTETEGYEAENSFSSACSGLPPPSTIVLSL